MKVLVTGGAGYIGSTVCSALEDAGHVPVVLDSVVTGRREFVRGRAFYEGDVADRSLLDRVVSEHEDLYAVVHCAARIVVPESVAQPGIYYRENVTKSLELFTALAELGVSRVVFSSSGSIYATTPTFEVTEDSPLAPTSPYARTKMVMEMVLEDLTCATSLRGMALRYFNPVGADPAMRTGLQIASPSHALGKLVDAALGRIPVFELTGTDLPTRDGTGLRDYLHVWDLARAHVAAVERFDDALGDTSYLVLNLGSGTGSTVRELQAAVERVVGRPVPTREAPPRPGDAVGAYANADRAAELLGWRTELSLDDAIRSALEWAQRRPQLLGG